MRRKRHSQIPDDVVAARIDNDNPGGHCGVCSDDGTVTVHTRVDPKVEITVRRGRVERTRLDGEYEQVEEIAPCPACLVGYRVEFGLAWSQPDRFSGRKEMNRGSKWGRDGYWKGGEADWLASHTTIDASRRLTRQEEEAGPLKLMVLADQMQGKIPADEAARRMEQIDEDWQAGTRPPQQQLEVTR